MLGDELRQIKHADLLLAAEDRLDSVVRVDLGPLLDILKVVPFDLVLPGKSLEAARKVPF